MAIRTRTSATTTLSASQFTYYLFTKNLQGDIVGIYTPDGAKVAEYRYDAWGNHVVCDSTGAQNTTSTFIGNINPFRYRGYYFDTESGFYYLNSRYYDPQVKRFISADDISYLGANGDLNSYNLYAYCSNNPVMYSDTSGNMPKWAQWVVGGLAVAGLVVATVLTCGAAGAGAAAVGAAMLAGGVISGGINAIDQLHDEEDFNWSELAISTLSGTMYGLVIGLTGGAGGWAVAGKFAVSGGTSLLNSWNENATFGEATGSLALSLVFSAATQGAGYLAGKFGPQILSKIMPRNPNHLLTMGDVGSALWGIKAVKTGVIRFVGGIWGSIINDF